MCCSIFISQEVLVTQTLVRFDFLKPMKTFLGNQPPSPPLFINLGGNSIYTFFSKKETVKRVGFFFFILKLLLSCSKIFSKADANTPR